MATQAVPTPSKEFMSDFYEKTNKIREILDQKFVYLDNLLKKRKKELLSQIERIEELHRTEEIILDKELQKLDEITLSDWTEITPDTSSILFLETSLCENPDLAQTEKKISLIKDKQARKTIAIRWYEDKLIQQIDMIGEITYTAPTLSLNNETNPEPTENTHYKEIIMPFKAFGKSGDMRSEFNEPRGILMNPNNGDIFIADSGNHRVQIFTYSCIFKEEFGSEEGPGKMNQPWGLCLEGDFLYCTQWWSHCVKVYRISDGNRFVAKIGKFGQDAGQFSFPEGLCVSKNNQSLFVCDTKNNRVQVFDAHFNFLNFIGVNKLLSPRCIIISSEKDELFVLDNSSECLHIFNCKDCEILRNMIPQGHSGLVYDPYFFVIDFWGNILISDRQNHCIKIFSKEGELMNSIGQEGYQVGSFYYPMGICLRMSGAFISCNLKNTSCIQYF